ncbi:MAG: hypothetical protein IJF72_01015 [Clostridia bacterium]|nr:hypothetical protein [Clostridia bacterium]
MKKYHKKQCKTTRIPLNFGGVEQQFVGNPMLLGGNISLPDDSIQIDKNSLKK